MTPDRVLDLERVLNFRDFGGYDAAGGARVKRGLLFRSAHFSEASEEDKARLDALGVRFLVDLRRTEERALEPNRWPGEQTVSYMSDMGPSSAMPPHMEALMHSDLTAASVEHYMHSLYRDFPAQPRHVQLYTDWFRELSEGGAGVIHCAAGKDRTGLGCALTLHVLGVDEATIFADYEYTNTAVDLDARLPRMHARIQQRLGRPIEPEALRPMLCVKAAYLRDALTSIDAQYGSIDGYLTALGVDDVMRERLKENYLE